MRGISIVLFILSIELSLYGTPYYDFSWSSSGTAIAEVVATGKTDTDQATDTNINLNASVTDSWILDWDSYYAGETSTGYIGAETNPMDIRFLTGIHIFTDSVSTNDKTYGSVTMTLQGVLAIAPSLEAPSSAAVEAEAFLPLEWKGWNFQIISQSDQLEKLHLNADTMSGSLEFFPGESFDIIFTHQLSGYNEFMAAPSSGTITMNIIPEPCTLLLLGLGGLLIKKP